MKPGIYHDLSNEDYHNGPGISKSGLWTIYDRSPFHYHNRAPFKAKYLDFGEATHLAVLQPNDFEARVIRGPEDRRGKKWSDLVEAATFEKKLVLTESDYDGVLRIRDMVFANPTINAVLTEGDRVVEASGYYIDEPTGELCRVRPDLYRRDLRLVVDVKTDGQSAAAPAFARATDRYGYHAQEAKYTDGWRACGEQVDAFLFLVIESKAPNGFAIYELPPAIVDEGRAIIRQSLDTYHECRQTGMWPGYADAGVQELPISRWAYRLTEAPNGFDEDDAEG